MHHTGGLRDYIGLISMRGRTAADGSTIYEALQTLARQTRANAAPGTEYEYSNTGYFLLGVVIARVSGRSLAEFSEERIFRPLGMNSTRIVDRYPDGIAALARGYAESANGFEIDETGWEQVGDGQVHSDLHDLALWDENFYSGKVGGIALVRKMYEVGALNSGERIDYAAGLRVVDARGVRWVSHGGSWVGYRSQMLRVPSRHVSVIVLCNRDDADTWKLASSVAKIVLGDDAGSPPEDEENGEAETIVASSWRPQDLERYAGVYFSEEAGAHCRLYAVAGRLVAEGCADGAVLRPGKPGVFEDQDGAFTLTFPGAGARVDRFVYDATGLRGLTFERVVETPSTLIVNASIIDGSGAAARPGAVRIEGDRIAAVGELAPSPGETLVDAGGLALAPGFIDTHSHHDRGLFASREALAAVSQGITTIVAGQDGEMTYSVAELFARQAATPAAVNVASYVGHGNLREAVMGRDFRRHATPDEVARMRALLAEGMKAGALGLATGLEYDPGIYSSTDELVALAREAASFGGRYISHIRSEDRYFWAAIDEILRIGREAKIPVQISHMKLAMVDWWGQSKRLLDILDQARAQGVDVTADVYPYEYWQSTLTVLFPQRDFANRKAAEFALASISPPEGLLISEYTPEPDLVGKTVAEIAQLKGLDPAATLMDLIARSQKEGEEEGVIGTSMTPEDVTALIAWPHANICSDGALAGRHPRGAGAFTRVLRVHVREEKRLLLEAAVHKMTALAAAHVGLEDRGMIRPGAHADLVLFDPKTVADRATTEEPSALSAGIERVWVNGVVIYEGGKPTGKYPGQAVRRP
jgi:N-acyl-D-amino-acid deacylase